MWWKSIARWLRDKVDVDVDLELDDGVVVVVLTVRLGGATLLTERFEWTLPAPGAVPHRLASKAARRGRTADAGG